MAAFDTAITPVASTPANTSNATLFTASADTSVLVDVANILSTTATCRIGVTPSGGSVHYKLYDVLIPVGDGITGVGPIFLQNGDAVVVRSSIASNLTFSASGVRTS